MLTSQDDMPQKYEEIFRSLSLSLASGNRNRSERINLHYTEVVLFGKIYGLVKKILQRDQNVITLLKSVLEAEKKSLLKKKSWRGVVPQACNPSILGANAGRLLNLRSWRPAWPTWQNPLFY